MGLTFRVPSHQPSITANSKRKNINSNTLDTVVAKRRRRWWHFCSHTDARSASLAQFLEVERRFGDAAFYVEGLVAVDSQQQRTSYEININTYDITIHLCFPKWVRSRISIEKWNLVRRLPIV
ncbi:hypothetical protein QL285_072902 [Trifolium repens]|nr:hypothetical protein QL285_072902 [Trifolium repens]